MQGELYIITLSALDDVSEIQFDDVFELCNLANAKKKALRANPNSRVETAPAQLLGIVDNKVVGQETVFPVHVKAKGQVYDAIAGSGLYVQEDYRKSKLGVSLITKREELSADGIALGCGLSRLALPAHLMFDYLCFSMPRLMWIFKSRSIVETRLGKSLWSQCISFCIDQFLTCMALVLKALVYFRTTGMTVSPCDRADVAIEELINADDRPFACEHSAAWLNWQLNHSFSADERSKQKLYVIKALSGQLLGFFMYKMRFHPTASHQGYKNLLLGSLMEWQSSDQQKLSHVTIALLAILEMQKEGVDAVEICTDEKAMISSLRKLMLCIVGELSFVIRATENSPLRKHTGWDIQKNWRLRPSEGDNGLS